MSRLRLNATPVRVTCGADGLPCAVQWRGRPQRVTTVFNRWRIDGYWWDEPVVRDYVMLLLEDGALLLIVQDCDAKVWHIRRVYG